MEIEKGIEIIVENCGETMFVKLGSTDVLCKIVGFGTEQNIAHKEKEDLFILCYKLKHNDVDFPIETLSRYNIIYKVEDANEKQYCKVPFECSKIYKNKIISSFV
jgi:hypothetical protein